MKGILLVLFLWPITTNGQGIIPLKPQDSAVVSVVPTSFHFSAFYKKYTDANGIPVISSGKVPDAALVEARKIILQMLGKVPDVIPIMVKYKIRVAVMSVNEVPTDIPEHSDLNRAFPETDWNQRGRGYGATIKRPATSCAEENLLCYTNDRYKGENILVHEFAHTIHEFGLRYLDPMFDNKLEDVYSNAKKRGLWVNTYAISNQKEYWAEGVQDWYNVNLSAMPSNGIHNEIHTRQGLKNYDHDLYDLISLYFNDNDEKVGCQAR